MCGKSGNRNRSAENTGTAVGALTGALVGSQFGGSTGSRIAAGVAGAAIGGLIGNRIGAALDDDDRQRAYAAQMQALEAGPSGRAGELAEPRFRTLRLGGSGPAYQRNGGTCRQYTHTIYIEGRPQTARGAACRNPGWDLDADQLAVDASRRRGPKDGGYEIVKRPICLPDISRRSRETQTSCELTLPVL